VSPGSRRAGLARRCCSNRGRYALTADGADDGPPELVDTLLAWPRHADWI